MAHEQSIEASNVKCQKNFFEDIPRNEVSYEISLAVSDEGVVSCENSLHSLG